MEKELQDIATTISQRVGAEMQTFRDQMILIVSPERIVETARALKEEFGFSMLSDETAVDYWPEEEPRFHIVYQLRDVDQNRIITIRVPLNGHSPRLETLEKLFPNANWHERELWDLFGIYFEGHSDMRRIMMPSDWEGHPLRKDYPLGYEDVRFTFNAKDLDIRKPHPKE